MCRYMGVSYLFIFLQDEMISKSTNGYMGVKRWLIGCLIFTWIIWPIPDEGYLYIYLSRSRLFF